MHRVDGAEAQEEEMKPACKLIGQDGNVFNLIGLVGKALRKAGQPAQALEMSNRIMTEAESYDKAIQIIMEYVEVE